MGAEGGRLQYAPGLDGLRALAVVAVLLFHFKIGGVDGGFLGVSLFFTLSGYLITQVIVRETASTGRLGLGAFWERRWRRLAPPAVVCLVAVLLLGSLRSPSIGEPLRGDSIASLLNVANWRFARAGSSYESLFSTTSSPLLHFWSLAIEEQFYIGLALLAAVLARWRTAVFGSVILVLACGSLISVASTQSHLVLYYGTHTRAIELLMGSLLGLLMPISRVIGRRSRSAAGIVSLPSLGVFIVVVVRTSTSSAWPYRMGFAAFALLSCVLIICAVHDTPLRRMLQLAPILWIGRLSYGLYMYHWPIVQYVTSERTGLSAGPLAGLRISLTVAVATLSYYLVEQPIRQRRFLPTSGLALMTFANVSVALLVAFVVVPLQSAPPILAGVAVDQGPVLFEPSVTGRVPASVSEDAQGRASGVDLHAAPKLRAYRVLVGGSNTGLVEQLRQSQTSTVRYDIVDRTVLGCPAVPWGFVPPSAECPTTESLMTAMVGVDLVVMGTTDIDHFGSARYEIDPVAAVVASQEIAVRSLTPLADAAASVAPILVVDGQHDDVLSEELSVLAVRNSRSFALIDDASPATSRLAAAVTAMLAAQDPTGHELTVMVVGDSTSYALASALATVGSDQLRVLWGGGSLCPIVPMYQVQFFVDEPSRVDDCPTSEHAWPDLVDRFEPDVVLMVASVPEQARQRYVAGGPWHVAGDDAFTAYHDEAMLPLQRMLARSGTLTLIATAPRIVEGNYASAPLGSDERIRGWNNQIVRWKNQWGSIGVVDWAAALEEAEAGDGSAGAPPIHRPDGVHLSQQDADRVVEKYFIQRLIESFHNLESSARASGCLTVNHTLDLYRCAATGADSVGP